ncbi:MBL fold metallo-hydrolase [Nocardia sp. NEAU-G5]|uniref:MBL fold metallo-hydrolase n=1 Tax=Nocardia albiluteola TaxID=2842303 RepID=A0ABS6AR03_9NOCA|nr:MBL fold metallo-hydrolase [Nocardia albiluteola]MBU3060444.1 MBL fold metallo-hydrolase [Nocardia albiluteola]
MHVHHFNCGTMRPLGGRLIDGNGHPFRPATMICHCLLVETDAGLVLIETGFGANGAQRPREWFTPWFRLATRPVREPAESAVSHLTELGYTADDVRHIVLTHADLDHAGGLADFPRAKVHVSATEHRRLGGARYRDIQFAHRPDWELYEDGAGESWFGLDGARQLRGLPDDIQLIPLPGHTVGHSGVAVRLGSDRWLLHAGDSLFFHGQLDSTRPHAPLGLRVFERIVQEDDAARRDSQRKLRALVAAHGDQVTVISAHEQSALIDRQVMAS